MTRTTLTRGPAASVLVVTFFAAQSAAQDHQNMPGMPAPTPTPQSSPAPKPSPSPSPSPQATPHDMEGMQTPQASKPPQAKPQPSTGEAANPSAAPQAGSPDAEQGTKTLPNLSHPNRAGWPSPTADSVTYTYTLFDLLEYQRVGSVNVLRWDFLGWRGGDKNRFWFKSEGELNVESPLGGEGDLQLLYGRHITPFFDLQMGVRFEQHYEHDSRPKRAFAVIGLQGLAPGRFEVEPALFLSNKGKLLGRFTGSLDLYQTQRLILQPRLETEFAPQRDEEFGIERGLNDVEIGLRLRYEVRREFAPYFGVSYRRSFGATRERVLREGGAPNEVQFAVGVRMWR